jgi:hypothetical protein
MTSALGTLIDIQANADARRVTIIEVTVPLSMAKELARECNVPEPRTHASLLGLCSGIRVAIEPDPITPEKKAARKAAAALRELADKLEGEA